MAKWIFYLLVFVYMCYRAVYGLKIDRSISVDQINYDDVGYLEVGTRKTINCRGSIRNQKLEWVDPFGKGIKRVPSNRIFAQELFVSNPKAKRNSALVLTMTNLLVRDSGLYECRSGELKKTVPVCVIKPSQIIDTPAEVTTEAGRAISLSCKANGDPEPKIVWVRNGRELDEDDESPKYKMVRIFPVNSEGYESLLTITSLEPEDGGLYKCYSVQESPMLDNCSHVAGYNITLQVKHAPQFPNVNETKLVFGKMNDVVDLKCTASGWPKPTYRWFKDLGSGALYEFDKTKIKFVEEPNMAVLSVTAGPTTFEKFYKCMASNDFGETEQLFQLLMTEKPLRASVIDSYAVGTDVLLNVSWPTQIYFPIKSFDIQYIEGSHIGSRKLRESDWTNNNQVQIEFEQDEHESEIDLEEGYSVKIEDLKPQTEYMVRVRATNEAGEAPWSAPVRVATLEETVSEEKESAEDETDAEETTDEPVVGASVDSDNGTFYGIFFAGAILIVAVVCMFAMRVV